VHARLPSVAGAPEDRAVDATATAGEPDADAARGDANGLPGDGRRPPGYRYEAVFLLVLALVLFVLLAPTSPWSRAVAMMIELAALLVAIATSRDRREVRRRRAALAGGAAVVGVVAVIGAAPSWVALALAGALAFAIPPALGGGLLRMVRDQGVTVQAVAGSLAIYIVIGLLFAWLIGLVARLDPGVYFAQGTDGTDGQRVYFSFTVLTTTGFGDLTVAQPVGRALTVLEMLLGQLYLVTVIGVVVGNFRGRAQRERRPSSDPDDDRR
jgi:ion channel